VDKLKAKGGSGNPYAICQAATHQSFATGKPLGTLAKHKRAHKIR